MLLWFLVVWCRLYAFPHTVYPKKYAHGFVVLCFVVVMQSFIMNSHEVFIHIHQGCFAGTGAIVRLPQCQWSKPDGYGKISQCITTTKHSKAKTVCIFLGIYCILQGYDVIAPMVGKRPWRKWVQNYTIIRRNGDISNQNTTKKTAMEIICNILLESNNEVAHIVALFSLLLIHMLMQRRNLLSRSLLCVPPGLYHRPPSAVT